MIGILYMTVIWIGDGRHSLHTIRPRQLVPQMAPTIGLECTGDMARGYVHQAMVLNYLFHILSALHVTWTDGGITTRSRPETLGFFLP
jgi:hypothetical protein